MVFREFTDFEGMRISGLYRLRQLGRLLVMERNMSPATVPSQGSHVAPRDHMQRHSPVPMSKPRTCLCADETEPTLGHTPRRFWCPQPGSDLWPSALKPEDFTAWAKENTLQLRRKSRALRWICPLEGSAFTHRRGCTSDGFGCWTQRDGCTSRCLRQNADGSRSGQQELLQWLYPHSPHLAEPHCLSLCG